MEQEGALQGRLAGYGVEWGGAYLMARSSSTFSIRSTPGMLDGGS